MENYPYFFRTVNRNYLCCEMWKINHQIVMRKNGVFADDATADCRMPTHLIHCGIIRQSRVVYDVWICSVITLIYFKTIRAWIFHDPCFATLWMMQSGWSVSLCPCARSPSPKAWQTRSACATEEIERGRLYFGEVEKLTSFNNVAQSIALLACLLTSLLSLLGLAAGRPRLQ